MKTIGNAGSTARKLEAVASGALPNGDPVVVNADGTVSIPTLTFGPTTTFENANTGQVSAAFDSNSNKVVIAYVDSGNSGHGTAIVVRLVEPLLASEVLRYLRLVLMLQIHQQPLTAMPIKLLFLFRIPLRETMVRLSSVQ